MTAEYLDIAEAGLATVQDLGRSGVSRLGVSANGASDQYSARWANVLLGRPQGAPLIEVTGSALAFAPTTATTVAVTGASADLRVDGRPAPLWCSLRVGAGEVVSIRNITDGLRCYVGVGGEIEAPRFLGSTAPDRALGFGRQLASGDRLPFRPACERVEVDSLLTSRIRPRYGSPWTLDVCAGPEWDRFAGVRSTILSTEFTVDPKSNHVGIRLLADLPHIGLTGELSSRGVAIGAVEITPSQELVLLHRGRSITAGYPVVLVVTTSSLAAAGQLRPGDRVRFRLVTIEEATARHRRDRSILDAVEQSASRRP